MIKLKNANNIITIKELGAEIISWTIGGQEVMHNTKEFWNRTAPILFPFVGNSKFKEMKINNKIIKTAKHGYCRDSNFAINYHDDTQVQLNYDISQDNNNYPLKIVVNYHLFPTKLQVKFSVVNNGDQTSYFKLGWHPGFKIYGNNYQIEKIASKKSFKTTKDGFLSEESFIINENLLDNFKIEESLIIKSSLIKISNPYQDIELLFTDFPYLVIWKPQGANLVCLEPWTSPPDSLLTTPEMKNNNNVIIKPGETLQFGVDVKINFKELLC